MLGNPEVGNDQLVNNTDWQQRLKKCGTVLDFAPDLAAQVVDGSLTLDAAFKEAERNRDAERNRLDAEEHRRSRLGRAFPNGKVGSARVEL